MYKREEAARLREEFWTTFGRYMGPVPAAEGGKVNWINYRTGIKDVYFRMHAGHNSAAIEITLEHRDATLREYYFMKFAELKVLLHVKVNEEWTWEPTVQMAAGKTIGRIGKELADVSVYNREQWPDLISFFKPRVIALDDFWAEAKYHFEQ